MSNLLRRKKSPKHSVVSVKTPSHIVHYAPWHFYTYALFLNAFLLLVTITHEISGLVRVGVVIILGEIEHVSI